MPKYHSLIEEVLENMPNNEPDMLLEYSDTDMNAGRSILSRAREHGGDLVHKAGEYGHRAMGAAREMGSHVANKASEYGHHAVELAKAHPYAAAGAGVVAAAAGGLAARSWMKRRAAKAGVQRAQGEMAKARSHMRKLGPSQKKMVSKRGSALRAKMEEFNNKYGSVGVNALTEAVMYQYYDFEDLRRTPVTEIANIVEQTLLEKETMGSHAYKNAGKLGATAGVGFGAVHAAKALGHAGYLDHGFSDLEDVTSAALVVGGSVLVGAAVGALLGKGAQWIAKAVSKGMSREKAQATMVRAKKKLQSDGAFAAKVRKAAASRKKKRR